MFTVKEIFAQLVLFEDKMFPINSLKHFVIDNKFHKELLKKNVVEFTKNDYSITFMVNGKLLTISFDNLDNGNETFDWSYYFDNIDFIVDLFE